MRRLIWTAIALAVVMTVLTGLAYPLAITGVAQVAFHHQADGSLIGGPDGRVVGSELIGQSFADAHGAPLPQWFQPRPSAAGSGYDAMASGAANLGPTNPVLLRQVAAGAAAYRRFNGLAPGAAVPVDAVTSSGSGLDPEISIANARLQAVRVARVRHISVAQVDRLIDAATVGRVLGVMGEPGVNVIALNRSLIGARTG
jgi:potassium-transporting ATPase KdpC subunit